MLELKIDIKKNIENFDFQGEYVAPEKIENIYIQSKYIAQAFVYGNGYKVKNKLMQIQRFNVCVFEQSFTVAILVPDAEVLEKYTQSQNISGDMVELCKKKVCLIDFGERKI